MSRLLSKLLPWSLLASVPGGVLWALSPLGVRLSEYKFKTPDVFWKMFPSAPLLLLIGLVGIRLWKARSHSRLEDVGFYAALLGLALLIAGDVGLFYLRLDDTYLMTAPAYRAFRLGLILAAAGSMLFAVMGARSRALPLWGALPFAIGSLCGLISGLRDFESFGAALWVVYGAGWAWLGVSLLLESLVSFLRSRRRKKS